MNPLPLIDFTLQIVGIMAGITLIFMIPLIMAMLTQKPTRRKRRNKKR